MGGGGLGAFCSSRLRSDVVKNRGLSVLDAATARRPLPAPTTMLDMATKGVTMKEEWGVAEKREMSPHSPFNFQHLSSHKSGHVLDSSLRSILDALPNMGRW